MIHVFAEYYSLPIPQRLADHGEYQIVAVSVGVEFRLHGGELLYVVELVFEVG